MAFSVDVVVVSSAAQPHQPTYHPTCLLSLSLSLCPTHTRTHMKSVSGQLTLPFRAHLAVHQPVCLRRGGEEERGGEGRVAVVWSLPYPMFRRKGRQRNSGGKSVVSNTYFRSVYRSALMCTTTRTRLGLCPVMRGIFVHGNVSSLSVFLYLLLRLLSFWALNEIRTTALARQSVSLPAI